MKSGFDQHLANHITGASVFRVVTDPAKADAVITDRLGKSFEEQMKELYPPPPPPPEPAKDKEAEKEPDDTEPAMPSIRADQRPTTNMSSSTGTIFVVDRRSNQVIWSTYVKPKSFASKDLNSAAAAVVKRIQEALQPGAKH